MDSQPTIREAWRAAWRRPVGRWPWIRWGWTLLLPAAIMLWLLSLLVAPEEPDLLTITVESQVAGRGIESAEVLIGETRYLTDVGGRIIVEPVPQGTLIIVSADGHETMRQEVADEHVGDVTVSLSGVLLSGTVTDRVSNEPVSDAEITILDAKGGNVATTGTDRSGMFVFKLVPEDAEIVVRHAVYGEYRQPVQERRSMNLELEPPAVSGRVVDADGRPVTGIEVSGENTSTTTDDQGRFSLDGVGQGSGIVLRGEQGEEITILAEGSDLGDIALPVAAPSPMAISTDGTLL